MGTKYEMCFCVRKDGKTNINHFLKAIEENGWKENRVFECGWAFGPSYFSEFVLDDNLRILFEVYTHFSEYDEYHISFEPCTSIVSIRTPLILPIAKSIYDLIVKVVNEVDVWCGNMGLENYGFELFSQQEKYNINPESKQFIDNELMTLAFLSTQCKRTCYDVSSNIVNLDYSITELLRGTIYTKKDLIIV